MTRCSFKLSNALIVVQLPVMVHNWPEDFPNDFLAADERLGYQFQMVVGFEVNHAVQLQVGPRCIAYYASVNQFVVEHLMVYDCVRIAALWFPLFVGPFLVTSPVLLPVTSRIIISTVVLIWRTGSALTTLSLRTWKNLTRPDSQIIQPFLRRLFNWISD